MPLLRSSDNFESDPSYKYRAPDGAQSWSRFPSDD
jgi:hypothetical protein